jgi:broad specificity phosphatase PhoE
MKVLVMLHPMAGRYSLRHFSATAHCSHSPRVMARLWDCPPRAPLACDTSGSTSKVVHLVRHGHAYHNFMHAELQRAGAVISDVDEYSVARAERRFYLQPALQDPPLTALGREDAKLLRQRIAELQQERQVEVGHQGQSSAVFAPDLFIVSPLRRATQTVLLAFQDCLAARPTVPVVAVESCREQHGIYYSDKRSDMDDYAVEFPRVSIEHVEFNEDVLWEEREREEATTQLARHREFLHFLRNQEDSCQVVVGTHSGWLHSLVNDSLHAVGDEDEVSRIRAEFSNGEMRSLLLTWEDESNVMI